MPARSNECRYRFWQSLISDHPKFARAIATGCFGSTHRRPRDSERRQVRGHRWQRPIWWRQQGTSKKNQILRPDHFFGKFMPRDSYTILLVNIFKWPLVMPIGLAPSDQYLTNWSRNKCMLLEWGLFIPTGWIGYFKEPRINRYGSMDYTEGFSFSPFFPCPEVRGWWSEDVCRPKAQ